MRPFTERPIDRSAQKPVRLFARSVSRHFADLPIPASTYCLIRRFTQWHTYRPTDLPTHWIREALNHLFPQTRFCLFAHSPVHPIAQTPLHLLAHSPIGIIAWPPKLWEVSSRTKAPSDPPSWPQPPSPFWPHVDRSRSSFGP